MCNNKRNSILKNIGSLLLLRKLLLIIIQGARNCGSKRVRYFHWVSTQTTSTAFPINDSSQFCDDIWPQLENDFVIGLQAKDTYGNEVAAINPLSWYPENISCQSTFCRMQLRKNQILQSFHEFFKLENEIENITRQEAVSIIPPLFLDVGPDHFVLDMCAAPGSKTFQLLEMIYRSTEPGTPASGMVIVNDVDVQRCILLIRQTKRMCTTNLIVTNHKAQQRKRGAHGFKPNSQQESDATQ